MKFSGEYNPYKILVKSEGGKNKAATVFSKIMKYCITRTDIEKTILMLDLDGSALKKQLHAIEQTINTSMAGESISIESSTIKKTTSNSVYLIENKVKIKESKKQIGMFYLILFASSLEKVADINDSDDTTTIERKISELVEMPNIQEIFSLVFS